MGMECKPLAVPEEAPPALGMHVLPGHQRPPPWFTFCRCNHIYGFFLACEAYTICKGVI